MIEIYDSTPDKKRKTLEYRYHLLQVRSEGVDVDNIDTATLDIYDSPRLFLRAGHLVHLDTFLCTHGQSGGLFGWYCIHLSILMDSVIDHTVFINLFCVSTLKLLNTKDDG